MEYIRCGNSGLKLPQFALGLWHNFGFETDHQQSKSLLFHAFDKGINHFDLANNYGPPPGSAETNFGRILKNDFHSHRDEIVVTTKAGHYMWAGPYGDGCSRKSLISSLDQSLMRLQTEYVDIFYSHRYDAETPLEETMDTLSQIVRQGKALYIGLSKYPADELQKACELLRNNGTPCIIYQDRYSMFVRKPEENLLDIVHSNGIGFVAFSPLAQGLLTDKYLYGIPKSSRATKNHFLKEEQVKENMEKIIRLRIIASRRDQSLAEMALAWLLRNERVHSILMGASTTGQIDENLKALDNIHFTTEELQEIETVLL